MDKLPICVDLDGTLIQTDLLIETSISYCKSNPLRVFRLIWWRIKGKAFLKDQVARRVTVNEATLPYNSTVLEYLKKRKEKGHSLILATGTHIGYAKQIARHLGFFDRVLATEGKINLIGDRKKEALLKEFGEGKFVYVGNSKEDLPIWGSSKLALLVNTSSSTQKRLSPDVEKKVLVASKPVSLYLVYKQIRVYQWIKNILIFVPMLSAFNFNSLFSACLAFFSFSFLASAIYVINDLYDLAVDRAHPRKKFRPFASGALSIEYGPLLLGLLFPLSFFISMALPPLYAAVLMTYLGVNIAYNSSLKRKPLLDVFCLSSLYLLRVIGGAVATKIPLSPWLISFALFLFISLALVKRYTELATPGIDITGRGYKPTDQPFVGILGVASGSLSVLVLALYLNSEQVARIYPAPECLWLLIPLMFYWLSRIWLFAFRLEMVDDPILFTMKDKNSRYIFLCFSAILWISHFGFFSLKLF